jgi:peroxiredoxin
MKKEMTVRKYLSLLLLLGLLNPWAAWCEPIKTSGKMDLGFSLPAPKDASQASYLGLDTRESFLLNQVEAKILIIEIFSMYCPICQREAADVNKVFDLIQNNSKLKDQVKLMGIGAGNSAYEVGFFKENYKIQFPLFSDGKFVIHKRIGEVGTPHFIGLTLSKKKGKNKGVEIFYSQSGEIKDPVQFLATLIKASGQKF